MTAARRVPLPRSATALERSRAERLQKVLRRRFARYLPFYGQEARLTQRMLAGISRGYLSAAELGRREVTLDIPATLASFLKFLRLLLQHPRSSLR